MNVAQFLKSYRSRKKHGAVSDMFDASFYLSQFSTFERDQISNPLKHFLTYWSQNGFDPNPFFSMSNYRLANPDVAASNINPLVHFVENGMKENRPLIPDGKSIQMLTEDLLVDLSEEPDLREIPQDPMSDLCDYLVKIGVEFDYEPNLVDEEYYRSYFPFEELGDCQHHFEETGWKNGLNPTPWFNTKFYLKLYDDVERAGINPFIHFTTQGYLENRLPNGPEFNDFIRVLDGQSIEEEAKSWINSERVYKTSDLTSIEKLISKMKIKDGGLVISIGHSRYLKDIGGIQLYVYKEAEKFNQLKVNYLYLSPLIPLPMLAEQSLKDLYVNMTFNNKEILGNILLSDIPDLVSRVTSETPPLAVVLNSIYGWHPELLTDVIEKVKPANSYWVFHDYSTFCSNPRLNFEDSRDCGNPKPGAAICSTCRYGRMRDSHVSRISLIRESRDWISVTPSRSTSANVSRYLRKVSDQILTIPHGKLTKGDKPRMFSGKPRIAYVGHPVASKGWSRYMNFVNQGLKEFEFFHFGATDVGEPGVTYFSLVNEFTEPNKARDLLVEHQIDAVFICPSWQETFCFVAYEALSAGCQIICNSESGNVVEASSGASILMDVITSSSISRVKAEILNARESERYICEFEFTGTIASEFLK